MTKCILKNIHYFLKLILKLISSFFVQPNSATTAITRSQVIRITHPNCTHAAAVFHRSLDAVYLGACRRPHKKLASHLGLLTRSDELCAST